MRRIFVCVAVVVVLCLGSCSAFAGWSVVSYDLYTEPMPMQAEITAARLLQRQQVNNLIVPNDTWGPRGWTYHAGFWTGSPDNVVDLNPLLRYGTGSGGWTDTYKESRYSELSAVSGNQQVGTVIMNHGNYHASLWTGTAESWIDLTPTGPEDLYPTGANGDNDWFMLWDSRASGVADGHQVGTVAVAYNNPLEGFYMQDHASLWAGTAESYFNLQQFVVGPSSSFADSIYTVNDDIWIAGSACWGPRGNYSNTVGLVWHYTADGSPDQILTLGSNSGGSPVPEPATLLGFGIPVLMVGLGKLRGLRK